MQAPQCSLMCLAQCFLIKNKTILIEAHLTGAQGSHEGILCFP